MKVLPKTLFAVIGLVLLATPLASPSGFAAAADAAGKPGQRYKFVVITHATAVPFFVPVRKGVEEAGKLVGADVTYTGPAGFDIQKQIDSIKSAIAQNVDGIATT